MRANYETCLIGEKCVLAPYRPEHVATYHAWMKDPHLLEATGSEPLSLEEEIAMQHSWRDDKDKCTFIVLAKSECDWGGGLLGPKPIDADFVQRNVNAMVGDVNLFLSQEEDDNNETDQVEGNAAANRPRRVQAELDIMVADSRFRGQRIGQEATCLMILYGASKLGIQRFFCKINEDNQTSLSMFERLGFVRCDYAECFRQVELELRRDNPETMSYAVAALLNNNDLHTIQCPSNKDGED